MPPGSFLMGSPESEEGRYPEEEDPQHTVRLTHGFWLGETTCTQAQWESVMGENSSENKGDMLPVENVSWTMVQKFCESLNNRFKDGDLLDPEAVFRLPSEAEWEYACRSEGGKDSAFNDGSACTVPDGHDPALDRLGWFRENSGKKTHPVAGKEPNERGLYDMHGNVWEWCLDGWREYEDKEQKDPLGSMEADARRVLRGGSAWDDARDCRSACRIQIDPGNRSRDGGFRLASGQPPGSGATGRSEG
ncbi:MAG: sulfatase modifying factor 1 [Limisphaerales bacterium]|jgi:sulfatase modifying factor 1